MPGVRDLGRAEAGMSRKSRSVTSGSSPFAVHATTPVQITGAPAVFMLRMLTLVRCRSHPSSPPS